MSKDFITPFSNGTESMMWYDENCSSCKKAFFPKVDDDYPSEKTMKQYCSIGKECKLKYAIDMSFITAELPINIAEQIGLDEHGLLKWNCLMFSDKDDDGFKYPKRPTPDNTPQNQLVMPILLNEISENDTQKQIIKKLAIQ